jgi:hypothetical protein
MLLEQKERERESSIITTPYTGMRTAEQGLYIKYVVRDCQRDGWELAGAGLGIDMEPSCWLCMHGGHSAVKEALECHGCLLPVLSRCW